MILLAIVTIPLAVAVLSAFFRSQRLASAMTFMAAVAILGLSAGAALNIITSPNHLLVAIPHWLALDALSAVILLLVAVVNLTAALFSMGYMHFRDPGGVRRYYLNYNLFVFSMLLVPLIQEPSLVWVAVELTTVFSVLLVGFEDTQEALEAAWKYVVLTIMGAAIALFGFLMLYWAARQADVPHHTWSGLLAVAPQMSPVLLKAAFVFILVGLGAKIGLVPLHTWLPDAHSQAPTPVCALLSGVETTTVLYVILRLLPVVSQAPAIHAHTWILAFGLISVGTAAFLLINVRDYKRLFAFSTVEHMGIIMAAAGLGGASAHAAAMLQIIAHSFTKSFCFYTAGGLLLEMRTRDISSVRGLIRREPFTASALLLGGLAIAGAPPFALFLSEFSILRAGLNRGQYLAAGLLVIFIAIAFSAIMNHISRMVFGPDEGGGSLRSGSLPLSCKITLIIAAIPVIVLGIYIPGALQKLIALAAAVIGG
ncbi:proton-conducting transporter membrane subunit [Thermosulfurimonas sp.]|uniref:proton-conducting transporter transmembrane domain-containing protein n=1 Tax=Thermosulfurimonas sp. TaxID=2080236 RepID=UPI0025D2115F|nr:proton-conducting transporter membrane subunit [Thermosulfurimonas sp.]